MESRISILPPQLADQIAAGEVVERPSSVVKELVENALDAGATRIDIEVEGGERRRIRVTDDGCGMTREEAHLCLLRHATSKLREAGDLACLRTMGFRGEALPSIAAVSRLSLLTRRKGELSAWRIELEGGAELDARDAGAPEGTQIEVRDLLYNMPARRKFLKSEPTEAAHITETVTRLALAFPSVHFRLRHGPRLALDLPPQPGPAERAEEVLGRELFLAQGDEGGIGISAYLLPPDLSQTTSRSTYIYVDQRFVRDRGLGHALLAGYGELIPRGRFPVAVLFVTPPAGTVDVNVHPQKVEVRFARPQDVYAATRHVVARAVARAPWLSPKAAVRVYSLPPQTDAYRQSVREAVRTYAERAQPTLPALSTPAPAGPAPTRDLFGLHEAPLGRPDSAAPAQTFFARLRYIGQLHETYLVCEAEGELVLVDQHAAHERVAFERLKDAHAQKGLVRQRLLFPALVPAKEAEMAAAAEHAETLAQLGFEIEPFAKDELALKAVPEMLAKQDPEGLLRDILSDLSANEASSMLAERIQQVLARMACHSVVRAGDTLSAAEARALLDVLDGVDFRGHCPHGRPVLLRMPLSDLERRFGRT
jgi:DNA mismatch repair protein MutL